MSWKYLKYASNLHPGVKSNIYCKTEFCHFCFILKDGVSEDRKLWRGECDKYYVKSCETLWILAMSLPLNLNPTSAHTHNANPNHYSCKYKSLVRLAKHQVWSQWVHWPYALYFNIGAYSDTSYKVWYVWFCLFQVVSVFCFCTALYRLWLVGSVVSCDVLCMCSSLWFCNIICMNPWFGDNYQNYQTSTDFPCVFFRKTMTI